MCFTAWIQIKYLPLHCKQKERESLGLVIINHSPSVENLNE